jgi:hypothetical protein
MRITAHLFTATFILTACALTAHASAVDFDLTLAPANPTGSLSGSFLLAGAPPSTGIDTYSAQFGLDALNLFVDGHTFTLANDPTASVTFINGQLVRVSFDDTLANLDLLVIVPVLNQAFLYDDGTVEDLGKLTVVDPPAVTPEPSTLLLLTTGILGGVAALYSTRRKAVASW